MKQETIQKILKFRDERDWKQYHSGKDLSISILLEVSELLEIFQWSKEDVIKDELADILIYSIMLADYYKLNIDEIIDNKLNKNLEKYPSEKNINLKNK